VIKEGKNLGRGNKMLGREWFMVIGRIITLTILVAILIITSIPTVIIRQKITNVIKENSLAIKIEQRNERDNRRNKIKVRVTNFTLENITKKVTNTINFIKVVIGFDETKVWHFGAIVTKDDVLKKLNIEQVQ